MALSIVNNPVSAGLTEAGKRSDNHLPMQLFNKPVWDEYLFKQSNSYWFTPLVESFGGEMEPITDNIFYWVEDGKWYTKQTVASATEPTSGTFLVVLNETDPYFAVNDVVDLGIAYPGRTGLSLLGRVTAIGTSGANQTITVTLIDPYAAAVGTIVVGDFVANNEVALLYNSHGECFKKPSGKKHTPDRFSAQLTKLANTYEVCDDASNRGIWFKSEKTGRYYWVDEEEHGVMMLHRMQRDMTLLFGQSHSFTDPDDANYEGVAGMGLIPLISENSTVGTFAGAVTEDDFIDMLVKLSTNSKCKRYQVICGSDFYRDALKAMDRYFVSGAVIYGNFGNEDMEIGINFSKYTFGDITVELMKYDPFTDPDFLPNNANGVNYSNFALFLCMEGNRLKTVYKKRRQGGKIKDWVNYQHGPTMAPNGQQYTAERACSTTLYTSHVGLQAKGLNDFGMMSGS